MPKKRLLRKRLVICWGIFPLLLLGVIGCTPQESAKGAADDEPQANVVSVEWSLSSDCVPCHSAEATSMDDKDCLAGIHKLESVNCVSCHNDEKTLSTVHENAEEPSTQLTLKKTKVSSDSCLACHTSLEEVAAQTSDIFLLDSKGTKINPHALPESQSHTELDCSGCHTSHIKTDTLEEARSTCLSCHHTNVFECGTCHN